MEYKTLNIGVKMTLLGIGVYDIPERETQRVVEDAVSVGYRSIIVIPKTTHKERMQENIDLFDFTLSDDDLQVIQRLDTGHNVTGWPSDALTYKVTDR